MNAINVYVMYLFNSIFQTQLSTQNCNIITAKNYHNPSVYRILREVIIAVDDVIIILNDVKKNYRYSFPVLT